MCTYHRKKAVGLLLTAFGAGVFLSLFLRTSLLILIASALLIAAGVLLLGS